MSEKITFDIKSLTVYLSLSRSEIYKLRKAQDFPAPMKLTLNKNLWHKNDIDSWVNEHKNRSA